MPHPRARIDEFLIASSPGGTRLDAMLMEEATASCPRIKDDRCENA